jgi:hypothetical protein
MRAAFLRDIFECDPVLKGQYVILSHYDFLCRMVSSRKGVMRLAKYACDVLALFDSVERFLPAGYNVVQ